MKHRRLSLVAGLATTLALVGGSLAPAQAAPPSAAPSPETYAALGDSFAAGWGAGQPVNELGQALGAHPVLLAGGPANLTFVADWDGVTTADVLTAQVDDIPITARQVTLTVGGNDLDFVGTLTACLTPDDPTDEVDPCQDAIGAALENLGSVSDDLAALIAAIHARAPEAKIYITGYPLLFQAEGGVCIVGAGGGQIAAVPAAVTDQLDAATLLLNRTIRSRTKGKVASYTKYVDVTAAFDGHGVCGTLADQDVNPDAWINDVFAVNDLGSVALHPTAEGQQAYAAAVMDKGFRTVPSGN